MDRYAKTLLTKVGHIFILYQPLEEKNFVSCTQAKIWVLEICPKIASHATFFMFLLIYQERDHLGKNCLITNDQHGCRNLGQDQSEKFWLLARREFLLQARYGLLKGLIFSENQAAKSESKNYLRWHIRVSWVTASVPKVKIFLSDPVPGSYIPASHL